MPNNTQIKPPTLKKRKIEKRHRLYESVDKHESRLTDHILLNERCLKI